jgi:ribosome-binding factor A
MQFKYERVISETLEKVLRVENKDPRISDIVIKSVSINKDLRYTHVSWAHHNFSNMTKLEKQSINNILQKAAPFFGTKVGQIAKLRFAPRIYFFYE